MTDKAEIINHIIEVEGGFVDDPSDSGGATNFGITEKVARANGFAGSMRDLTREFAFSVYSAKYWDSVKADEILIMSEPVAAEVVDTAINMGPSRAGKFLQKALNAFNNCQKLYSDISVDGIIGTGTLAALAAYLEQRDEDVLVKGLNVLQGAFLFDLIERREKDEKFFYGWFSNRI